MSRAPPALLSITPHRCAWEFSKLDRRDQGVDSLSRQPVPCKATSLRARKQILCTHTYTNYTETVQLTARQEINA